MSTTAISLRLPQGTLDRIKVAANKRDVPYQSLIKVWLAEKPELVTWMDAGQLEARKTRARAWFEALRDDICADFEAVEDALPARRRSATAQLAVLPARRGAAPIIPAHRAAAA